ncbi:MAG: hypothetical protein ACI4OS_04030 [Akkermansia sp.]
MPPKPIKSLLSLRLRFFPLLALATAAVLAGLCAWFISALPSYTGRDASDALPWQDEGICIRSAEAYWKSAQGDDRMALRTAYYPEARLSLGETQGSGFLLLSFRDTWGREVGDPIRLAYSHGHFEPRDQSSLQAHEGQATIRLETGYGSTSEMQAHLINPEEPLWTVMVKLCPEGAAEARQWHIFCVRPEIRR